MNNQELRTATKEDYKETARLFDREGNEFVIRNQYSEGIWEVRVWQGSRHVGDKVIFEGDAHHYKVISNS